MGNEISLKTSEAIFDQTTNYSFSTLYDGVTQLFTEKKVILKIFKISFLVYLKSTNGKIPAGDGIINLNSMKKGLNKISLNI